ncbi:hypothetical protein ACJMK2_014174 [Sinanodonta woodiana]|uniref:Uncharacterized protein n=1 Tax=Sinanodonta woodiana TaxID=1069815 RepID=A0ABD3UZS9_SINWO
MDSISILEAIILNLLYLHAEASFAPDAANLRSTMMSNAVDPAVRPNKTVTVLAGFSLLTINSVDNVEQSLTVTGWLTLTWTDYRLAWQPSYFGDIQEIHVQPSEIWQPEVIITNSLADIGVINDGNLQLTVTHTGDVLWEPPSLYTTHCELDVTYYPFDRQKCIIELTSWSMTKDQLELDLASDDIDTEALRTNGEWIIVRTSVQDKYLLDNKPDGTRRPAFYAINFILPIILSSFLSCVVFLVPIDAGEKVSYILTMILDIAVLLTLIASSLPHTSLTASVLCIYLAVTMSLSVLCALITVLLLTIFHNKEKVDTTSSFYKLTTVVATIIRFERRKRRNIKGTGNAGNKDLPSKSLRSTNTNNEVVGANEMDTQSFVRSVCVDKGDKEVYTWAELANIWNRFCFWVFITFTSLSTMSCLVALDLWGKKDFPST